MTPGEFEKKEMAPGGKKRDVNNVPCARPVSKAIGSCVQ